MKKIFPKIERVENSAADVNIPKTGKRKVKILAAVIIIFAIYLISIAAAVFLIDGRHVRFYITGNQNVSLEYGEHFIDDDVYAVSYGRISGEGAKHLSIIKSGSVDETKLGTYEITYTTRLLFKTYEMKRTVSVVDTQAPVLELNTIDGYSASWLKGYEEEGYRAVDNLDGDITSKVIVTEENNVIRYEVSDSSGNKSYAERRPYDDISLPEIQLEGGEEISIYASLEFNDPGFKAVDYDGSDLTEYVTVSGEVIPYHPGSYEIVYSLLNEEGEEVSTARTVNVISLKNDNEAEINGKIIYLTFDDGPGPYTQRLLDVLAAYDVRATFFVTNQYPEYAYLIGSEAAAGHSVAVHSYSHDYYDIYSSEKAYFTDFNRMNDVIYEQTGMRSKLFRFPGGSSNTVSNFNPGVMTALATDMEALGYRYFDWNVVSGDAGETTKTETVIDNVVSGCYGKQYAVVLQHDIKDFSVAAVERIIVWGLSNGYSFRALTENSPGAHHGINN